MPAHGGTFCQESVVIWPGDLLWVVGLGRDWFAGFPRSCRFRAAARPWVKLERPER